MSSVGASEHPASQPPSNIDKAEKDRAIGHLSQSRWHFIMLKMLVLIKQRHPEQWEEACLNVLDEARQRRIGQPREDRQCPIPQWDPPVGSTRRQKHARSIEEAIDQIQYNRVSAEREADWDHFWGRQQSPTAQDIESQIKMLKEAVEGLVDPQGNLQHAAFFRVRRASHQSLLRILKAEHMLFAVQYTSICESTKVCPSWAPRAEPADTSAPGAEKKILPSRSEEQVSTLSNSPPRPLKPPCPAVFRPLLRFPTTLGRYSHTGINFAEHALSSSARLPIDEAPDRPPQSSEAKARPPTQPSTPAPPSSMQSSAPLSISNAVPDSDDSRRSPRQETSRTILNTRAASPDRPMRSIEVEDYGSPALRLSRACTPSRAPQRQVRDTPQPSPAISSDGHQQPVTPIRQSPYSVEAHLEDDEFEDGAQERLPAVPVSPPSQKAEIHWNGKRAERKEFGGIFTISPNSRRRQTNLKYAKKYGSPPPPPVKLHSVSPARTLGGEEFGLED